jgi:hypothetical protein
VPSQNACSRPVCLLESEENAREKEREWTPNSFPTLPKKDFVIDKKKVHEKRK